MDSVFTIEQLRPIRDGMTISRDAKLGTKTSVTYFSLAKETSISQECYDMTSVYIGASGTADFLIGEHQKSSHLQAGICSLYRLVLSAEWNLHLEVSIQKSL